MADIDAVIRKCVDDIWAEYDKDNSGALDKEETKKFVQDTLGNLGSGDEFSDEAFDEVFATFDKDGSGTLTVNELIKAFKSLGTFADLSRKEVEAFVRLRDRDNSGTLELDELFALMGRDYADHLVLKLSRILDGVERKGTMIADCFAAWDADGGGSLSRGELTRGLRSLGIFNHMKPRDVEKLLDKLDDDKFKESRRRAALGETKTRAGVNLVPTP